MGQESTLSTQKQALESQKRTVLDEKTSVEQSWEMKEKNWTAERADLNQKLQDLLSYNEKVRDECLKKVVGYKEKYCDYKTKVRSANHQIQVLTSRVARYEGVVQ